MVYCAVVGCSSNNKKKSEDSEIPKFRFFRFPSSKEICKLWVNNCFQKNKFNTETARICSRHFTEDDYQLKEKLLNLPMDQYKLKKDAIPSINLPVPTKEQTISQKIRDKRMETRTLIKNIRDTEQNYASDLPSSSSTTDVEIVSAELQLEVMTDVQPQITNKDAATQTVSSNELSSLQDQIRELQKQNRTLAEQLQKERDENRAVEKIFTVGQLRKLKTKKQIHWSVEDDETIASDSEEIGDQHLDELDWDGLENLAGFIAFKLRKKENLGYIPDSEDSSFSWTNHLTEGGLQKPKEDFLTKCNELDKIFNHYNGTHLKIQKNYLKNLYELAQNVDLSDDAKNLFFRCKMYFRMRILNNNMKEAGNVRKRKMIKTIK